MSVIETPRLALRELIADDAAFILELVNDPSWLRHIGDKGVRTLDDARAYIASGPAASYARFGFGLWCVLSKATSEPVGICGLIKRDSLADVDIGYALLPRHAGFGFAHEAAAATLAHAREVLNLPRVVAIVSPDNAASIRLLEKLGLHFETRLRLPGQTTDTALYAIDFVGADAAAI